MDKPTCSVDGCERDARCRGWCHTHYIRHWRHGDVTVDKRLKPRRAVATNGYVPIQVPGHPLARTSGRTWEHRVVLHDAIGPGTHPCHWCGTPVTWTYGLTPDALVVDHLNGLTTDNRIENLVPACQPCNRNRGVEIDRNIKRPMWKWASDLRDQGMTYGQIGTELGVSETCATDYVRRHRAATDDRTTT